MGQIEIKTTQFDGERGKFKVANKSGSEKVIATVKRLAPLKRSLVCPHWDNREKVP